MSYKKLNRPCWEVHCDICGEAVETGEGGTAHFATKEEAMEAAKESDYQVRAGKLACDACICSGRLQWRGGQQVWTEPAKWPEVTSQPKSEGERGDAAEGAIAGLCVLWLLIVGLVIFVAEKGAQP